MKTAPVYASDRDFINPATLSQFGNSNAHLLRGKPRAFVLELPGLGGGSCLGGYPDPAPYDGGLASFLAQRDILLFYAFPGPWSWMCRGAVRTVNATVDALREAYGLDESTPWVVMGGSMGGQGSLLYCAENAEDPAHRPVACLAHCPCVDVETSYACKENVPRGFFTTLATYDMPMAEALKTISPLRRMAELPPIPYMILNDLADELFPYPIIDGFVEALRGLGHTVTYYRLPDLGHGALTEEAWGWIRAFLLEHTAGRE